MLLRRHKDTQKLLVLQLGKLELKSGNSCWYLKNYSDRVGPYIEVSGVIRDNPSVGLRVVTSAGQIGIKIRKFLLVSKKLQ